MKLKRVFAGAASILIPVGAAHAQAQQSSIQQLQNMQQQQLLLPTPELRTGTNAPELYSGENADIGPQRILQVGSKARSSGRKYFDLSLDSQFFFTDNANFAQHDQRIPSGVFVNTAQVAIAPDPYDFGPGKFAPSIGFSSQWYNYTAERMQDLDLDFDAQTAFVNLRYLLGNWQFAVGGNYTRLVTQGSYTETYNEWLPNLNVQRAIVINDTTAVILGDAVSYHFSKIPPPYMRPDINDHFDDTAYVTLSWQATSHFAIQPFYRFQYSYYQFDTATTSKRYDYLNAAGVTLLYTFNPNVSLRAFFSYTTKTSSDPLTPTYDEINGGIGATLDIRF